MNLIENLRPFIRYDGFSDDTGFYTVSSIYFDSPDNLFYNETLNRQTFRQKLRLRIYNQCGPNDMAFFEIKMKFKGFVKKRRTKIKLGAAGEFILADKHKYIGGLDTFECTNRQVLKEISFLTDIYNLSPKAIVSYERQAFISKDNGDLRITFDMAVRSRDRDLVLENGSGGYPAIDDNIVIMEIKTEKNMPGWLVTIINRYGCKDQSFSKYCSHYKKRGNTECFLSNLKESYPDLEQSIPLEQLLK